MQKLEKLLKEIDREVEEYMEIDFGDEYNAGIKDMAKMAEKIIRKHMNDGWIPVEKEQPEEDGFYIVTMDGEIFGQEEPFVGLAEFENEKWIDDEEDYKCVIAWRPMPEVYRPADKTERSEQKCFCGCVL